MSLSSEQTPFASPVQEFTYRNLSAVEKGSPAPIDFSIFERGTSPGGRTMGAPGFSEMDFKKLEAAAFERGRAAGRAESAAELERAMAVGKNSVHQTIQDFSQEKERYFRRVEGEIVELALAVAKKILHREAQVDRTVLSAVVRVALEKITGGQVSLCVPPSAANSWRQYFATQQLPSMPEIVEDPSLSPEQLVLKTSHGSTSLGLDTQFSEIEKGFTDLVEQKQRSIQ